MWTHKDPPYKSQVKFSLEFCIVLANSSLYKKQDVTTMYILRTLYIHYKYILVACNVRSSYISVAFFKMYLQCTLLAEKD